jgi:hypothetical protein
MRHRAAERGSGNLGCILWVVALVLGILIAWKVIPVKIASAQLYDFMEEVTKFSARTPPEELKKQIVTKAATLDLPVNKDNIKVQRIGDSIRLEVSYTVPLEFPGYTYNWDFHHQIERSIFIF